MPNFTIFTGLFAKLDHIVLPICDNRLITVDHRIPIGCSTFLRASRASSHDVTAIKKAIKIFSLACKWSIVYNPCSLNKYFLQHRFATFCYLSRKITYNQLLSFQLAIATWPVRCTSIRTIVYSHAANYNFAITLTVASI